MVLIEYVISDHLKLVYDTCCLITGLYILCFSLYMAGSIESFAACFVCMTFFFALLMASFTRGICAVSYANL